MINKIEMTEEDVRAKYIDPSIRNVGWNEETQIRREFSFTNGRIFVKHGKVVRGKRKIKTGTWNFIERGIIMIKFILENFDTIFKNENSLETLSELLPLNLKVLKELRNYSIE